MLRFSLAILLAVGLVHSAPTVDNALLRALHTKGTANVAITLSHGSTDQVLSSISAKSFATREERLNVVAQTLKMAAAKNQADIRSFINKEKSAGAILKTFWITNTLIVRHADLSLVQKLMSRPDVAEIREELVIQLDQPIDLVVDPMSSNAGEQWGVTTIQAPAVWAKNINGKGVVVANIDTGVRGTHEALAGNHRAAYGWFDPEGQTQRPTDNGGHGTHTMGSIVGTARGVGVAPGALWIACKGCGSSSCTEFALISCGEFVACPTDTSGNNADCSQAPHVVSNSWGGGQNNQFYEGVISAWRSANIVPLFSQGNAGPSCGSANSPGDSKNVIGVGSTVQGDTLSSFSSVGPTAGAKLIKPDIAAPGSNVFSAYNTGDTAYATMSGTSMACPHAAGLSALILSAKPGLSIEQVQEALQKGATHSVASTGRNCGGVQETQYPNHHVGHGRIDAVNSINVALKF